jgi:hypothetical protein
MHGEADAAPTVPEMVAVPCCGDDIARKGISLCRFARPDGLKAFSCAASTMP